jgi:hypothetical protein
MTRHAARECRKSQEPSRVGSDYAVPTFVYALQ